jgi:hypothetical protein
MDSSFRNKEVGAYSPARDVVKLSCNLVWTQNEFSVPTNGSRDPQQAATVWVPLNALEEDLVPNVSRSADARYCPDKEDIAQFRHLT